MHGILQKISKKGAVTPQYVSPNQLTFCGFETPFEQALTTENRWVKLSKLIPWDKIVGKYDMQFKSEEGRPPISGRVVIGAVIIKHLVGLTDRETVLQIQENMFLQYFLGYSSFTNEAPFSPSLFVLIRERLSADILMGINDIVIANHFDKENDNILKSSVQKNKENDRAKADETAIKSAVVEEKEAVENVGDRVSGGGNRIDKENDRAKTDQTAIKSADVEENSGDKNEVTAEDIVPLKNQGRLLMDATVAPQNITYPTDLKLLNAAREKSEQLIDKLYIHLSIGIEKPRTYRQIARGHLYLIHKPSTIQYWLDSCNSFAMKIKSITGLFDEQNVLAKLTQLGDPLVLVSNHIDFSLFEKDLLKFTGRATEAVKPGKGRPGYNVVTMVKILFLQRLYNLSDAQVEFQITDRLSFRRFLSIPFSDAVPDCKTVWAFRESLNKTGENRSKQLFELFLNKLNEDGLIEKEGKMMDATFVSVPIQRNSRKENAEIKEGKIPSSFSENKNKLAQKDTDASWTKKNNVNYFGYKNHIKAETKRKFITGYIVTDAAPHDSTQACELLTEEDRGEDFYGDSAYQSPEIKARLKALEMKDRIIEKGHRNHPLTVGQKQTNRKKSKTRCRIEHIFGHMTNNMNDGTFIRTIGKARATVIIGLNNLVYNICRYVQLKKLNYA